MLSLLVVRSFRLHHINLSGKAIFWWKLQLFYLWLTVLLVEIRGFKLVIGWFLPAFSGWIEADPWPDQQDLVALGLFGVCVVVYNGLENDFIWRLELDFGGNDLNSRAQPACTHFCWTVAQFSWSSGINVFFFSHQHSNVEICKTLLNTWFKSTFISGVKIILRKYALRPRVNLSCDFEIVYTLSSGAT